MMCYVCWMYHTIYYVFYGEINNYNNKDKFRSLSAMFVCFGGPSLQVWSFGSKNKVNYWITHFVSSAATQWSLPYSLRGLLSSFCLTLIEKGLLKKFTE